MACAGGGDRRVRARARVLLAGPGRVGQAFIDLASVRTDIEVAGVVRSSGPGVEELLATGRWDVVADATPTDLETGGPALDHGRLALGRGIHFATAAKGPLVKGYRELLTLAASTGAGFRFSAATGAGLPTVDTVEFALAGAAVESVEGVLNGTSNFVLDRMAEGAEMEMALDEARQLGIADGDGRQDISGADTAAKLVAIANAIWGSELSLRDVAVEGLERLTTRNVQEAAAAGGAYRLVGTAGADGTASVGPKCLDRTHPLTGVRGAEKAITFHTGSLGVLTLVGGKSDPRAAAAALLRDVVLLLRVGARG